MLIGCDGVHSVVAQWLGLSQPIHSGRSAVRGMSVFPEGHGIKDVEQLIGDDIRAGIAPVNDKELYWFINHPSFPRGALFILASAYYTCYHHIISEWVLRIHLFAKLCSYPCRGRDTERPRNDSGGGYKQVR